MIDIIVRLEDNSIDEDVEDSLAGLGAVLEEVAIEYLEAEKKFKGFHSKHDGLAIIQEEFEELKEAVFWPNKLGTGKAWTEAKQLAAMAIRFMVDIPCDDDNTRT